MISLNDVKQLLNHNNIADYVSKSRKDDMTMGILYVAGASVISLATSLTGIVMTLFYSEMFESISPVIAEEYNYLLSMAGFDATTMAMTAIISSLVGFFAALAGLAATHYIAEALGGKGKIGEYFYAGGRLMFAIVVVLFALTILVNIPFLGFIMGILMVLFVIYAVYLFTILASALYGMDEARAFLAVGGGWLLNAILASYVLSVISSLTGLDLGLTEIEKLVKGYG